MATLQENSNVVNEEISNVWIIQKPDTGELQKRRERQAVARRIAVLMHDAFGEQGIRDLGFFMGPDFEYDNLEGKGLRGKINALVVECYKRNELDTLLAHLRKARPKVNWP